MVKSSFAWLFVKVSPGKFLLNFAATVEPTTSEEFRAVVAMELTKFLTFWKLFLGVVLGGLGAGLSPL